MTMTLPRYLALGVAAFLVGALLNAPASLLYSLFTRKQAPPVQLYGISGHPHEGRLAAVVVKGEPVVTELGWRLQPLWLLAGRLAFDLTGDTPEGSLSGRVAYGPGARLWLSDFTLTGSVKPLLAAIGYPLPWVSGQGTVNVTRLKLHGNVPTDAQGKALLHNLTLSFGPPALLGDFSAEVAPDGDALVTKLASVSGPLDLAGDARLNADGSYESKIQVKAHADAPPPVTNLLRGLGAPDVQGFYHIDRHGTIAPAPAPAPAPAAQ